MRCTPGDTARTMWQIVNTITRQNRDGRMKISRMNSQTFGGSARMTTGHLGGRTNRVWSGLRAHEPEARREGLPAAGAALEENRPGPGSRRCCEPSGAAARLALVR